jgi:DNA primase
VRREYDVERVLEALMIEVERHSQGNLICCCPFHEDRHPSFAVTDDTGAWICYVGCGEGNIVELVMRVMACNAKSARRWLESVPSPLEVGCPDLPLWSDHLEEHVGPPEFHYTEGVTHKLMLERGFTKETLAKFRIGWDKVRQAIVIPVYWEGVRVGLIYRNIPPLPPDVPKYEYTPHLPKSELLFGMEHVTPGLSALILVEGPLDCMWLHQCGWSSAVSILGMHVSKAQAALIEKATYNVVMAFDADEAGAAARKHARKVLSRCYIYDVVLPPGKKDVAECTIEEVNQVMAQALKISPIIPEPQTST